MYFGIFQKKNANTLLLLIRDFPQKMAIQAKKRKLKNSRKLSREKTVISDIVGHFDY